MRLGRLTRLGLAMGVCGVTAAALLPHPVIAWHQLGQLAGHSTSDKRATNDLTLAVSSLVVWLLIIWLTTTLLMLAATQLPGRLGAAARAASCLVIPSVVRRLICSALSISLAGGMLSGTAQAAGLHSSTVVTQTAQISPPATPADLDWPSPEDAGSANPPDPHTKEGSVTVQSGDSLWKISAQSLGAQASNQAIAATWPQWWERNRDVIGDNPHLIHPGQQLNPPSSSDKPNYP